MTDDKASLRLALQDHYLPFIQKHGDSFQSVNWGSQESQNLRFEILLKPFVEKKHVGGKLSLLDVGCGLGHLFTHLQQRNLPFEYLGIDIIPDMVAQAKLRHPEANFEIATVSDIKNAKFDVVVASGIFYVAYDQKKMNLEIEQMFSLCNWGIAFNSLSKWAPSMEEPDFYADPQDVLSFCQTLSTCLSFKHDYMPHDFSVHLFKFK